MNCALISVKPIDIEMPEIINSGLLKGKLDIAIFRHEISIERPDFTGFTIDWKYRISDTYTHLLTYICITKVVFQNDGINFHQYELESFIEHIFNEVKKGWVEKTNNTIIEGSPFEQIQMDDILNVKAELLKQIR